MIKQEQELLIRVIDLFAQRFSQKAILRGGMVLRLLGCERLTNDLDYIFVPYRSKNEIVSEIIAVLNEIQDADIEYSINSKCLRIVLTVIGVSIQIEVKVATELSYEILSTKALAQEYNYPTRLIRVMDYSVAFAHKLAAWNERRLIRDVYDIWFFLKLGVVPDIQVLERRLEECSYSRLVKDQDRFLGQGIPQFYEFLITKVQAISQEQVNNSLGEYLPLEELAGLAMKFRAELVKLK